MYFNLPTNKIFNSYKLWKLFTPIATMWLFLKKIVPTNKLL